MRHLGSTSPSQNSKANKTCARAENEGHGFSAAPFRPQHYVIECLASALVAVLTRFLSASQSHLVLRRRDRLRCWFRSLRLFELLVWVEC